MAVGFGSGSRAEEDSGAYITDPPRLELNVTPRSGRSPG